MFRDGLSNMVEDSKLEEIILDQTEELPKKGEKLLKEANQNGGKDNIAVILVEPFTNEVEKMLKTGMIIAERYEILGKIGHRRNGRCI